MAEVKTMRTVDAICYIAAAWFAGASTMILLGYYFDVLRRPSEWQCIASHREGPEHDQHDVCDQYSRKDLK